MNAGLVFRIQTPYCLFPPFLYPYINSHFILVLVSKPVRKQLVLLLSLWNMTYTVGICDAICAKTVVSPLTTFHAYVSLLSWLFFLPLCLCSFLYCFVYSQYFFPCLLPCCSVFAFNQWQRHRRKEKRKEAESSFFPQVAPLNKIGLFCFILMLLCSLNELKLNLILPPDL